MKIDRQSFRTGVSLIDNQHEQYVDLVDELFELCQQSDIDQADVDAALRRVLAYALEHFDAEEAPMRSTGYHAYESHRAKHDEFRDEADRLCAMRKEDSAPDDQLIHLTKWLVEWFCEQTLVHDKALAAFLKRRER